MVENHVFCTDVKPHNMLVSNNYRVYVIDFDTDFCSIKNVAQNSKKIFEIFGSKFKTTLSETETRVLNGYRVLNILQVASVGVKYNGNKNCNLFGQYIVQKFVNNDDIQDAIAVADIPVTVNSTDTALRMLKHYMDLNTNNNISKSAETIIIYAYAMCVYGPKVADEKMYECNLKRFDPNGKKAWKMVKSRSLGTIYYQHPKKKLSQFEPPDKFRPYFDFENDFLNYISIQRSFGKKSESSESKWTLGEIHGKLTNSNFKIAFL